MYTIAHDIARFKEYSDGELIIRQDHASIYDLQFKNEEAMCINQLKSRDPDLKRTQHQFMKDKYPKLSEQWKDHAIVDKHKDNMEGLKAIKQFKKSILSKAQEGEKMRKFKTPKQKAMVSYIKTLPGNENTNIEEDSKMDRILEVDREDRKAIELKTVRNKKLSKCITDERTGKLNN